MTTPLSEAARTAAQNLRAHRYDTIPANEQLELWQQLNALISEISYHLDREQVIPADAVAAARAAATLDQGILSELPDTAELLLTTLVQRHVDALRGGSTQPH